MFSPREPGAVHALEYRSEGQLVPQGLSVRPRARASSFIMWLLTALLALIVIASGIGDVAGLPLFQPQAVVQITPQRTQVQDLVSIEVPISRHIGDSPSRQVSVPATGSRPAQASHGHLVIYNQSSQWRTVAAGTQYTSHSGIPVSIDATAQVPPWTADGGLGSVTIAAHALTAGAAGNIPANDVIWSNDGLIVKNAAPFSGGQEATTVISQQDVDRAKATLLPSQQQIALQALQKQSNAQFQPIGSPACQPSIRTDQPIGTPATTFTLTTSVQCQVDVYLAQDGERLAGQAFVSSPSVHRPPPPYRLQGHLVVDLPHALTGKGRSATTATLTVLVRGAYVYQLDLPGRWPNRLRGLSLDQARHLLLREPGIAAVDLQLSRGSILPSDSSHIVITEK